MPITAASLVDSLHHNANVTAFCVNNHTAAEIEPNVRFIVSIRGAVAEQEVASDQVETLGPRRPRGRFGAELERAVHIGRAQPAVVIDDDPVAVTAVPARRAHGSRPGQRDRGSAGRGERRLRL